MKKIIIALFTFVLVACAPSEETIQKAIAQTQAAYTPTITFTPAPTATIAPSPTPRFDLWSVSQAQDAIIAAGLEFANPTSMTKDDYGLAPMSAAEAVHFFVPSMGSDKGGRLYSFANSEDLALMESYYKELGRQSAAFFSWVFVKDNILIQINGDLPEETARKYEAALNSIH